MNHKNEQVVKWPGKFETTETPQPMVFEMEINVTDLKHGIARLYNRYNLANEKIGELENT